MEYIPIITTRITGSQERCKRHAIQSTVIDPIPASISPDDLIRKLTNNNRQSISGRIRNDTAKAVKELNRVIRAKGVYRQIPVTCINGSATLNDGVTILSKKITTLLTSCDRAVLFLVTIGSEAEKLIDQKMRKQPRYGYLLDVAASLAAETAADCMHDRIRESLETNEQTTLRYSPGYCDWPLSEQRKIFEVLANEEVGIELSDHCLMSPRKSISGMIGISTKGSNGFMENICQQCFRKDCPYRRGHKGNPKESNRA